MKSKIYLLLALLGCSISSYAQGNQFVAEIKIFAGNFAPTGWAFCDGRLMPISQNTALFSLLGTTYGGDGKSTFALPDLRERVAIAQGTGPGLSIYDLGEQGGVTPLVLAPENLPAHNHTATVKISSSLGTSTVPLAGGSYGVSRQTFNGVTRDIWSYINSIGNVTSNSASFSTSVAGNSVGISNRQPYLVCNYIIALQGIFPPRQ